MGLKLHYRSTELCKYQALSVNPDFDQRFDLVLMQCQIYDG